MEQVVLGTVPGRPRAIVVCWVMDGASPLTSDNLKLFLRFRQVNEGALGFVGQLPCCY